MDKDVLEKIIFKNWLKKAKIEKSLKSMIIVLFLFFIVILHQQILEKCSEIKWHFIGHLQTNKVKDLLGN